MIDGLRFIAIVSVVMFHLCGYAGYKKSENIFAFIFQEGWVGVELFFIISGFILAKGFCNHYLLGSKPVSLKKYYLRRVTRLEPTYIAALLVYYCIKSFVMKEQGLFDNLLASIVYCHNFIYGYGSEIIGVAWSLEVEVQFYLLSPLIAKIFLLRSVELRRMVLTLLIVGLAVVVHPIHGRYGLLKFLHYFLVGYLLCDIFVFDWRNGTEVSQSWRWDLISIFAWVSLVLCLKFMPYRWVFIPWMMFFACVGAFKGPWSRKFLSNPLIYVTGGMCYTIYLYHTLLLRFFIERTPIVDWLKSGMGEMPAFLLISVSALFIVFTCSAILYYCLEKPFMCPDWPLKIIQHLFHRKRRFAG